MLGRGRWLPWAADCPNCSYQRVDYDLKKTTGRPRLWNHDSGHFSSFSCDWGFSESWRTESWIWIWRGAGEGESDKGTYGFFQTLICSAYFLSSPPSVEVLKTVSAIIDAGSSINLYMFHGGTNFGFINGAVHFHEYKSHVTSYGKYFPILILSGTPQCLCVWAFYGESFRDNSGAFNVFGFRVLWEGRG